MPRFCTCVGSCRGKEGLGEGWACVLEDPLVRRDSSGNLAPIAQFSGDFTAHQAADHFAGLATPEPRRARPPEGTWDDHGYSGRFRLVGGRRDYLMTLDRKYRSWRVYLLPRREIKAGGETGS